jgi:hypothetical protein
MKGGVTNGYRSLKNEAKGIKNSKYLLLLNNQYKLLNYQRGTYLSISNALLV